MRPRRTGHEPASETRAASLWYVPDRRVTTKAAADQAKEICGSLACYALAGDYGDEHELFRSLHACAYRATRRSGARQHSPDRQGVWAKRWQSIRDCLVERNMPMAYTVLARSGTWARDRDDMRSAALFALVQAVERFDPWRGFRFSTYAWHAIRRAIRHSTRSTDRYRRLFPLGYDPCYERAVSPPTADDLYAERLQRALDCNLGELTELESEILSRRFPMNRDLQRWTLQQVGESVGLSKERVRQIQNTALSKLRDVLEADPVLR